MTRGLLHPRVTLTVAVATTAFAAGQWSATIDWLFIAGWMLLVLAGVGVGFVAGIGWGRDEGYELGVSTRNHPAGY